MFSVISFICAGMNILKQTSCFLLFSDFVLSLGNRLLAVVHKHESDINLI